MITQVRHIGIVVEKLDNALEFYRDALGFKVVRVMEENGPFIEKILGLQDVNVTTVKMSAPDGNLIELLCFKNFKDRTEGEAERKYIFNRGISHIALTVSDLELDYQRIKSRGARFISPPQTNAEGTAKVAFCEDPLGNILELVEVL